MSSELKSVNARGWILLTTRTSRCVIVEALKTHSIMIMVKSLTKCGISDNIHFTMRSFTGSRTSGHSVADLLTSSVICLNVHISGGKIAIGYGSTYSSKYGYRYDKPHELNLEDVLKVGETRYITIAIYLRR